MEAWAAPIGSANGSQAFADYRHRVWLRYMFILGCIALTIVVVGYAATVGAYGIGILDTYETIWNHIIGDIQDITLDHIVWNIRLPRIVVGIFTGAALAVAGAVMQSILLNPLADPYTTGVSSGASFGATLAITLGATVAAGRYAIVMNAFLFSLIPTLVIIAVSQMRRASPTVMIMSGIAVMYIFNAFTTLMMLWADPNSLEEVYQWQVGSLSRASWTEIPLVAVIVVIGIIAAQLISGKLNLLATGDENARAMGVDAGRLRIVSMMLVALISAVVVSFTGLIGFVGLVAPHIVRIFIGPDNRYLIPASAAFGALLLVAADVIGRVVITPSVLQVGVVTAFMGGPLFLWLIVRKDSQVWRYHGDKARGRDIRIRERHRPARHRPGPGRARPRVHNRAQRRGEVHAGQVHQQAPGAQGGQGAHRREGRLRDVPQGAGQDS